MAESSNGKAVRIEKLEEHYAKLDSKMDTIIGLVTELDKTIAVANAQRYSTCPVASEKVDKAALRWVWTTLAVEGTLLMALFGIGKQQGWF